MLPSPPLGNRRMAPTARARKEKTQSPLVASCPHGPPRRAPLASGNTEKHPRTVSPLPTPVLRELQRPSHFHPIKAAAGGICETRRMTSQWEID